MITIYTNVSYKLNSLKMKIYKSFRTYSIKLKKIIIYCELELHFKFPIIT